MRANEGLPMDGSRGMQGPLIVKAYLTADLPSAADWDQGLIEISDEPGGPALAFSDGSDWLLLGSSGSANTWDMQIAARIALRI